MSELKCPLCNEIIKTGQVRKEWWMSDIDKRVAHDCCITAYEKGITKGKTAVNADLEFAYKRAKVLADLLEIPVHESTEVTGTILGLVRGSVERVIAERKKFQDGLEEIVAVGERDSNFPQDGRMYDIAKDALEI